MKIQITPEDIRDGKHVAGRDLLQPCAVDLAARRAFGTVKVSTGKNYLYANVSPEQRFRYTLPHSVVDWIARFDRGEKVEPFEFEVC